MNNNFKEVMPTYTPRNATPNNYTYTTPEVPNIGDVDIDTLKKVGTILYKHYPTKNDKDDLITLLLQRKNEYMSDPKYNKFLLELQNKENFSFLISDDYTRKFLGIDKKHLENLFLKGLKGAKNTTKKQVEKQLGRPSYNYNLNAEKQLAFVNGYPVNLRPKTRKSRKSRTSRKSRKSRKSRSRK